MRLSRSNFCSKEIEAINRVIEIGYTGMGEDVREFEKEIKNYLGGGVEVACVNTGSAAVHLAVQAIGAKAGDEILVPSLTYVASFQMVSATGATPIPCEVQLENGLLDLEDAKKRITKNTKAVMYVQYASNPGDLDALYAFAKENNLRVIEDAAHAFGCKYKNQFIGTIGDVICFSFDGIKNITAGEGGAVVTKDPEVIQRVRDARLLGVENDTEQRFKGDRSWSFDVHEQGWRYHMSNIMAAIGRVQLDRFASGELSLPRAEFSKLYRSELASLNDIALLVEDQSEGTEIFPHIFPVRALNNSKEKIKEKLKSEGIEFGFHYCPNHLLAKFNKGYSLPIVERLGEELITLPLHTLMTKDDVIKVCSVLKSILN